MEWIGLISPDGKTELNARMFWWIGDKSEQYKNGNIIVRNGVFLDENSML